jgi:hypothetical protein
MRLTKKNNKLRRNNKLTRNKSRNNKLRRNKSRNNKSRRNKSRNNKLRRNKSKNLRNKNGIGGKAIPPSDYPNTVRRSRDSDGNLIQQLPFQQPQPQVLGFPQFDNEEDDIDSDNEVAPDDRINPPAVEPQYSAIDSLGGLLPEDTVVVRLVNVPLAARTPENLEDFNDKRYTFMVTNNQVNIARRDGNPFLSLNDVIRLEARLENLRNYVYNRYGRDISEEWEPDQGIVIESESGSESDPNEGNWI